jgi:peptidoglycan/xylan/chitin deacetylase (PgdA/CDA1 family)
LRATFYLVTGYIGSNRRFKWMEGCVRESGAEVKEEPELVPLNWDEVLKMKIQGMEFGSHSHTHRSFSEVDLITAAEEVDKSFRELKAHVAEGKYTFACPFGTWRETAEKLKELIQGSGYSGAFLGKWGCLNEKTDPYDMPRLTIYGWDTLKVFRRKIDGSYDWLRFVYLGWHLLRTSVRGKGRSGKGF